MALRRVTVFGGSGFLGRYVVERLADRDLIVQVAVRDPEAAKHLRTLGQVGQVTPFACDVTDAGAVARAVDGSGRTPLEVARRAKKADVINFLEQIDAEKDKGIDPLPLCAGPNGSCSDAGCALS